MTSVLLFVGTLASVAGAPPECVGPFTIGLEDDQEVLAEIRDHLWKHWKLDAPSCLKTEGIARDRRRSESTLHVETTPDGTRRIRMESRFTKTLHDTMEIETDPHTGRPWMARYDIRLETDTTRFIEVERVRPGCIGRRCERIRHGRPLASSEYKLRLTEEDGTRTVW